MEQEFRDLVMITKLVTGEHFISVMVPVNDQLFICGFPMNVTVDGVGTPWFNMTANRVFQFAVNDIVFCKSPNAVLTTEYIEMVLMEYPDSYDFMKHCLENNSTDVSENATESVVYH